MKQGSRVATDPNWQKGGEWILIKYTLKAWHTSLFETIWMGSDKWILLMWMINVIHFITNYWPRRNSTICRQHEYLLLLLIRCCSIKKKKKHRWFLEILFPWLLQTVMELNTLEAWPIIEELQQHITLNNSSWLICRCSAHCNNTITQRECNRNNSCQ